MAVKMLKSVEITHDISTSNKARKDGAEGYLQKRCVGSAVRRN